MNPRCPLNQLPRITGDTQPMDDSEDNVSAQPIPNARPSIQRRQASVRSQSTERNEENHNQAFIASVLILNNIRGSNPARPRTLRDIFLSK